MLLFEIIINVYLQVVVIAVKLALIAPGAVGPRALGTGPLGPVVVIVAATL